MVEETDIWGNDFDLDFRWSECDEDDVPSCDCAPR